MNKPENSAKWSKERFDAELEKGYSDMLNGRVTPVETSGVILSGPWGRRR